jgi:hypothetical protein
MDENKEDMPKSNQVRDLLKETVVPNKSYFRLLFVFSCILFLMTISAIAGIIVVSTVTKRSVNNTAAIQRVKCELNASLTLRLGLNNNTSGIDSSTTGKYPGDLPSERVQLLTLYTVALRRVLTKKELKKEKDLLEKISHEPVIDTTNCNKILASK